jgi:response regulator NasT
MNLVVITDCIDKSQSLLRYASENGYRIAKLVGCKDEVSRYVSSLCPDALIVLCDKVESDVLREMRCISESRPVPVLVFTRDSRSDSIDAAVKAGASAYVVDCDDPTRLGALLDVAKARFMQQQKLKNELSKTKYALQERKRVEKAKGIVMKMRSISEEQAYDAMRKLAMNNNKRIGEVAEQIISASEVLI